MQKIDFKNLDLSRIKKEYLILIFAILIAAIIFVAYKGVFAPLWARIKKSSAAIEEKQSKIEQAKISPQALKELERQINKLKQRMESYQQPLSGKEDVPQILKELQQIAEGLKIKFVSVNPLKREKLLLPKSEEFLLQIPIKIKLQCGYHQLGIFIGQIENSTNFMKIRELKVNANPQNIWTQQVELVITSYRLVAE